MASIWQSEDSVELVLSWHLYMGSENQTQVVGLEWQALLLAEPYLWPQKVSKRSSPAGFTSVEERNTPSLGSECLQYEHE